MRIFAIYSVLNDKIIGHNNDLIVKDRNDLKHFKSETFGKTLIMGRKTIESLPKKLDDRTIIMLSTNPDYINSTCVKMNTNFIVRSPHEAIKLAYSLGIQNLYIAGGSSVYNIFSNLIDEIIETKFYQDNFDYTQKNLVYLPESIIELKNKFSLVKSKDLKSCTVNYFIK